MIKNKLSKSFFIQLFIFSSYFISWISISTNFEDILNFSREMNFNQLVNFFRQFLNLLSFLILLIIFLKKYKSINFKEEKLIISFFIYLLLQIPGIIFTDNSLLNLNYTISSLKILLIFILTNIYIDQKKYYIFFFITLFVLCLISALNYKTIINFFNSYNHTVLYTFFFSEENFFGKTSPRSTGSSRTFLLIYIISNLVFFKFFKNHGIIKIIFYSILSSIIILFQSRTTITILIIFIFLNFFYEKRFYFIGYAKYIFKYILLPIIFIIILISYKEIFIIKKEIDSEKKITTELNEVINRTSRPIDPISFSSGRFKDWKNIMIGSTKSPIFGFGAQGDRFLINQSASNGILYSLSSSGILGLIFFSFFSINCLFLVIKNLFKLNKFISNDQFLISFIILLILLRSLLESSYAVFGVDYIVLLTFVNYLNKFRINNKK